MLGVTPYLAFDGDCAGAMRFYQSVLGGKLDMMTNGQSPMAGQLPPGSGDRIMHARLEVDGTTLMASDAMPDVPFKGKHGFSLSIGYDDVAEGQRVFDALAEGGKVTMPFGKTFWAAGFGMLVDRFGVPWMINVESH